MGWYMSALFVSLALVLQCHQVQSGECNRRSTYIQIRIPQRTNVDIKYPKEINPVQFVPFPYNSAGSECIKCQGVTCNKCTYTKKSHSIITEHDRKTNIIIDIQKTRKINDSIDKSSNENNTSTVDGAIVGIYDKTVAVSNSGAIAKSGKEGESSAATASGTTLSQSSTLAGIQDVVINKANGEKSNVEDIYVASNDQSAANANSSSVSEGGKTDDTNQPNDVSASLNGSPNDNPTIPPTVSDSVASPTINQPTEPEQLPPHTTSDANAAAGAQTVVVEKTVAVETTAAQPGATP
ncbi:uncharacterized protein [Battus philenor]|uniref:uncharacterized protein n=1 Tax=Battus philenor TaxID=42288 RepID=UPI0035D083B2